MVAFLFAGQGSQYIGMGKSLYEAFAESRAIFSLADAVLGFPLSDLCFSGNAQELKLTRNAQPAILTASIAAYEAFKIVKSPSHQAAAAFTAGLSLGEYSALVAAGALRFEDSLTLVRRRAELMEEACQKYPGTMAAVLDLDSVKIKESCVKAGAEIANFNAPGQIVISGRKEAVSEAKQLCEEAGAKRVIELEVSGAFHSSLMQEASAEFAKALDRTNISDAKIPVVSNFTARPQIKSGEIKENLIKQLYSSVRWEDSMRFMLSQGVKDFYEFGPGKVLKGLMRRIDSLAQVTNIEKKEDVLALQ